MDINQIWEEWFCLWLKFLNIATKLQCITLVAEAHGDGSVSIAPRFTMSFIPNHADPNDSYYNFSRIDGDVTWSGDSSTSKNSATADGSGWNTVQVDENGES